MVGNIKSFLAKFEEKGAATSKYMQQMQSVSNMERTTVHVELDDVQQVPPYS